MSDKIVITESAFDEERAALISLVTSDAANLLKVSLEDDTPEIIVSAVDEVVYSTQKGNPLEIPEGEDPDLLFGCLWGSQLVKALNWSWVNIDFNDEQDSKSIAVVSPTRDMVIYPFDFVSSCLGNRNEVTIMLSFNMLKEKADSQTYDDCSYMDIMPLIYHIVPRG